MRISRNICIIVLIIINIAVDQISKILVRANVEPSDRISIIGDTFILMNVENSGAFLGMGSDLSPTIKLIFLLILPILVLSYLIFYIIKTKSLDRLSLIALSSIAGGGIANVYDRIIYGSVTDFFYLDFGGVFRTGIFNLADVSVTTGMIFLFFGSFLYRKKEEEIESVS